MKSIKSIGLGLALGLSLIKADAGVLQMPGLTGVQSNIVTLPNQQTTNTELIFGLQTNAFNLPGAVTTNASYSNNMPASTFAVQNARIWGIDVGGWISASNNQAYIFRFAASKDNAHWRSNAMVCFGNFTPGTNFYQTANLTNITDGNILCPEAYWGLTAIESTNPLPFGMISNIQMIVNTKPGM